MLRDLDSTVSMRDKYNAGDYVEIQTKALEAVSRFVFPRRFLECRMMSSLRLTLEASFDICLAQERSKLMVRPRSSRV